MGPTQAFPAPSMYPLPVSETDQNLFDEPFMLDVNFEEIFEDFVSGMDNPNPFVRVPSPFHCLCLADRHASGQFM